MKQKTKRFAVVFLAIICAFSSMAIGANAAAIRSASTAKGNAHGFTESGTVIQYSTYMYGMTSCSNVNAYKKVKNTYYYYSGSTLKNKSDTSAYVTNGFTGFSMNTNFISAASGKVVGIKGKHFVKYSGTVIWTDTCSAGTTS